MVAIPGQNVTVKPYCTNSPISDNRDRCIQKGLGCSTQCWTQTGGVWSAEEGSHQINYLELLATFLALQAFGKNWTSTTVLFRLDKGAAVTYINHKGGTTSALLCQSGITKWTWCVSRNIKLNAEHLPGHFNTIADHESRDYCNWMLKQRVFQEIREKMGPWKCTCLLLTQLSNCHNSTAGEQIRKQ